MTINTTVRKTDPYVGDDVVTALPFAFKVFAESDLVVLRTDSDGLEDTLTLNSDYTVSINPDQNTSPGGEVTLSDALETGYTVVVTSQVAPTQGTAIPNNSAFFARLVEGGLDRLTILVQQALRDIARAVKLPLATEGDQTIASGNRAGTVLGFDADQNLALLTAQTGTSLADLSAGGGSSLIGFLQSGTDAVSRTVQAELRQFLSVAQFDGADPTGATASTAAFRSVIAEAKARQTANTGSLGGGFAKIYVPRGFWVIDDDLDLDGFNGLEIEGDGPQATTIVFTKHGGKLFDIDTYLNIHFSDMSLFEGDVSIVGGRPTYAAHSVKDSVCCDFNGSGGGADFQWDNCAFAGWGKVFQTTTGSTNCDNHVHNHCRFYSNEIIWDNTNLNAVIWSFNECKGYYNNICFKNPGASMRVEGGDWINPGDFLIGSLASMCTDIILADLRMENYQNINPAATPRLLVLSQTHTITMRNVVSRGGGSLAGKTSASLTGLFNLHLERCFLGGNWDVTVGASQDGITSSIVFEACDGVPSVVQTLVTGQGFRPLNLEYRRHRQSSTGYIDRVFHGSLPAQSRALSSPVIQDMFRFTAASLSGSTVSKSCPIFVVDPYIVQLVGVEIEWTNNTANTVVIDVWESSSKATKLGTVTTSAASGAYQNLEIPLASILARYQINASSNPLYIEFTAASNAGTCSANVTLKFRQVN